MRKVAIYLAVALLLTGFTAVAKRAAPAAPSQPSTSLALFGGNWHEECQGETTCDTEEVKELWGSYDSECIAETCSVEELSELAGGAGYIDPMLSNFLTTSLLVNTTSFQSQTAPTGTWVWWYTGCNSTGMVIGTSGNVENMPSQVGINFNDSTLGFRLGSGVPTVRIYSAASYAGTGLTTGAPMACLSTSAPTFANNVKSAQAPAP
jgi:hypothetical protein